MNGDRVPCSGDPPWPPGTTPAATGIKNHGNTCYMNAVLQCLSHTDVIAEYFVLDHYKVCNKLINIPKLKFPYNSWKNLLCNTLTVTICIM